MGIIRWILDRISNQNRRPRRCSECQAISLDEQCSFECQAAGAL